MLLLGLASFFRWMDKPICGSCGTKTEAIGPLQPTSEDQRWHAAKVEGFKCPKCGKDERFPRYNHPGKLLGRVNMFLPNMFLPIHSHALEMSLTPVH